MSKKQQVQKNIDLSVKLTDYVIENPSVAKSTPVDSSYVLFSLRDKELNKMNEKIVKKLIKEGKTVIKAEETTSKQDPWIFTTITP